MKQAAIFALAICLVPQAAVARRAPEANGANAQLFDDLIKCRQVDGDAAKLACFERVTDQLQAASAKHDLVIIDRQQATKTKRTLFGFNGGDLSDLFGKGEEMQSIDGTIASASQDGYGHWLVTLEDGGHWRQIDDRVLGGGAGRGSKVVIARGVLGSYVMRVDGQPGIKVQRQN